MEDFLTVILLVLLKAFSPVVGIAVSGNNCGDVCTAVPGSPYTLTCTWSGSLTTGIIWFRDGGTVLTCTLDGSICVSSTPGYSSGSYPTSTSAEITITKYNSTDDSGLWECRDGADPTVNCTLPNTAVGNVQGQCIRNGNSYTLSCSGITHGSPPATLQLKDSGTVLASTNSAGSVSFLKSDAGGKQFTCEVTGTAASCMSNTTVDFACDQETTPSPDVTTNGTTPFITDSTSSSTTKLSSELVVIISVSAAVGGVIVLSVVGCYCWKRKRNSETDRSDGRDEEIIENTEENKEMQRL